MKFTVHITVEPPIEGPSERGQTSLIKKFPLYTLYQKEDNLSTKDKKMRPLFGGLHNSPTKSARILVMHDDLYLFLYSVLKEKETQRSSISSQRRLMVELKSPSSGASITAKLTAVNLPVLKWTRKHPPDSTRESAEICHIRQGNLANLRCHSLG